MTDEFVRALEASIAEENKGISYSDFVTGVRNGTLGMKVMFGEPSLLLTGIRRAVFSTFCFLYMFAPFILVPILAYKMGNWWFLLGVPISFFSSYAAIRGPKLILLFFLMWIGFWVWSDYVLFEYITIFYLCALWGYMFYTLADRSQYKFGLRAVIENPLLFEECIETNRIMIVRCDENTIR